MAYEKGLALNPAQPEILNNFAWLLVTTPENHIFDPVRALILAREAIHIKKAPHIWDTLAECLFANNFVSEAVQAEHHALDMNPEDRGIYEHQLKKFEQALHGR